MKRIKFILLAIAMLLAAPAFLTSCQEDAPEINYTMNVSVINDFAKVVEAINNGSLKNEQAIQKLTEAIDKMNADQQTKLQAIIDVLNSVNATLETKLAAIEAAMKAQTLTLESKLALLETAIKNQTIKQEEMAQKLITAIDNLSGSMETKTEAITAAINSQSTALQSKLALIEAAIKAQTLSMEAKLDLLEKAIKALPDYTSQLEAIKTAIEALPNYGDKLTALENASKALPDYSDKFDAVVAALNAMKTQIEALGTDQTAIATQIGEVTAAINNLIASVKSGNKSEADALAEIIKKLAELKGNIGGGGSGGETPGGETPGGETPGGETPGGGDTPSTEDYVDLGLPSGIKWATKNLGASKPSDYGDYYAWGETEPKAKYTLATYKWMQTGQSDWEHITKYTVADGKTGGIWYDASGNFIGDGKTTLEAADDAATQKLGSPWRMPTDDEINELLDNCTWTWTTQDGKNGYKVKGTNGNSIFVPAAGYRLSSELRAAGRWVVCWSGSLSAASSGRARYLDYFASGKFGWGYNNRFYGSPVRPVRP